MTTPEANIFRYTEEKELGRGPTSVVHKVVDRDGNIFARKDLTLSLSLRRQEEGKLWVDRINQTCGSLIHDNLVKLEDARMENGDIFIVMEFADHGSIKSFYEERKRRKGETVTECELEFQAFARDMAEGLHYMHGMGLVHRNLKCSNILLVGDDDSEHPKISAKISDLTSAATAGINILEQFERPPFRTTLEERSFWTAPESLQAVNEHTCTPSKEADVYSFGATILEMYTGEHPFPELDKREALGKLYNGGVPSLPRNSDTFYAGACARDLIEKCLDIDPKGRPTTKDILDHPFITGMLDGTCFGECENVPDFMSRV